MNEEIIDFHNNGNNNPDILTKYSNMTVICLKWISRLFLSCAVVSMLFGLILSLYTKSFVLTFGFELPFINLDSLHGWIINLLFQYSVIFFAYKGFLGILQMYFCLFVHACTSIDIIIDLLSTFNKYIDESFEKNQQFHTEAIDYLQIIINLHKKNNLYKRFYIPRAFLIFNFFLIGSCQKLKIFLTN